MFAFIPGLGVGEEAATKVHVPSLGTYSSPPRFCLLQPGLSWARDLSAKDEIQAEGPEWPRSS